jgi:phospholipid/cholesterol/gamma-HCH transport system permease protein
VLGGDIVRRSKGRYQIEVQPRKGGGLLLALSGRFSLSNLEQILKEYRSILERNPSLVELDLSRVKYLDGAGALGIDLMRKQAARQGAGFSLSHVSPAAQGILGLLDSEALETEPLIPAQRQGNFIERVGEGAVEMWNDWVDVVVFLGDFFAALGKALIRPAQVRWSEAAVYMEKVGADGLGIVGLDQPLLLGLIHHLHVGPAAA